MIDMKTRVCYKVRGFEKASPERGKNPGRIYFPERSTNGH